MDKIEKKESLVSDEIIDAFEQQTENLTDILAENIENLPLREVIKDGNIEKSIYLIDNAKDKDELTVIACLIRKIVEKNLFYKFNMQPNMKHYGSDFVMELFDFNKFVKNYTDESKQHPFANYTPTIIVDKPNNIKYVKVSPLIRFAVIGLPYKKAKKAKEYWKMINYFIHRSPECLEKSEELCNKGMDYARNYFKDMLTFFKENGLFDRD